MRSGQVCSNHRLRRAAAKAAADQGTDIVDLTVGEICADLAPTIRDGAMGAIRRGINRYTDPIGMMELREALARKVSGHTGPGLARR
ncbi:hypothetical protein [Sinorhizobium sp. 8-89]|uniref:hypothetical protein n=1 Tax=Sinorhizobium sp. 8-89 TaxID=3049089 RepID=UPI00386B88FD